jgi:hypothetical protein
MRMMYGIRSNGGEHGAVMTKKQVVEFMLDSCGYLASKDLSKIRLLDPAGGDGVFMMSVLDRLYNSSSRHGFDFLQSLDNLKTIEIDENRALSLKDNLRNKVKRLGFDKKIDSLVVKGDFLTSDLDQLDIIIGNPPYIRQENIPERKKILYRRLFRLFRHRSDLYIAFFEKSLNLLTKDGKLCFICPDRWLINRYGGPLRDHISENYSVSMVVNLNKADPFEEEVLGYPIIILIDASNKTKSIEYFVIKNISDLQRITKHEIEDLPHLRISMPRRGTQWIFEKIVDYDNRCFLKIEEQGFKIGIGVATGADSVFIGKNLGDCIEKELMLPIVLSKDIKNGEIRWSGNYILNPFKNGANDVIRLDEYPLAKKYLHANMERSKDRHVAKKDLSRWYKTIDRIYDDLLPRPKLLLPDIKKSRIIAMDEGLYYPHHNLYYIINESTEDLKILGALLMSEFSSNQLNNVSVKMHGGLARWQAQSLRKIFLPKISDMPKNIKKSLVLMFNEKDISGINLLVKNYIQDIQSSS